jgi:Tfp pilus assembly protein PilO
MAIDMNLDMGSMFKNLMKNQGGGQGDLMSKIMPFRNALIFLGVTGVLFGSYVQFYYLPMKDANMKKAAEIARLIDLRDKSADLEKKIASLKVKLTESKEHYLESLSHFGNSEDLGELYQSVSTLAAKYYLVVLTIKEVPIKAAPAPAKAAPAPAPAKDGAKADASKTAMAAAPAAPKAAAKPATEVKEIQVGVELKGKYSDYIKFKEDLAVAEMLLKVNTENIKVKNDKDEPGNIYVTLNLSTYAIDKKPFQKAIEEEESKKNAK